jgi:glycosyltransferase involved in cell wall biosynthesis
MIFFDTTDVAAWRHESGLSRVSRRLRSELGDSATEARWPGMRTNPAAADWVLTPELFSESERPGLTAFLDRRPCRLAAVYHDAIPIKHPGITWPKSVARHPGYMKLLARFDRVWAVSAASREELLGFWAWQGIANPPPVEVLPLGADWGGLPRVVEPRDAGSGAAPHRLVSTGILEPRKNQLMLIDACEALRREGLEIELHLVGRVNPYFGAAVERRVREARAAWPGLVHHADMDDASLAALVRTARATALASIAEGCGIPLLESLWMGVPCVCSDVPSLVENARGGGCAVVAGNDLERWKTALRRMLTDDPFRGRLASEALSRPLPTWAAAAQMLREALS